MIFLSVLDFPFIHFARGFGDVRATKWIFATPQKSSIQSRLVMKRLHDPSWSSTCKREGGDAVLSNHMEIRAKFVNFVDAPVIEK